MTYYKFLTEDNKGEYSRFDFTKYLPKDGQPGKWLPTVNKISLCERGYHAFKFEQIFNWMNAQLYEVELSGKMIESNDKTVAEKMRFIRKVDIWNDRTARVFACDCAERVLPIYEKRYPDDNRPRHAIEVARLYADGKATEEELAAARAAAWDAARAAARDAAWAAARDAEIKWQLYYLANMLGIAQ